jgi:replicative DNA helicase
LGGLAIEAKTNTDTTEQIIEKVHEVEKQVKATDNNTSWKRLIATWESIQALWKRDSGTHFAPELFGKLDFPNGTISYIGARTGRGKTTAMVNLAIEALFPPDPDIKPRKVLFVSLEESVKQIQQRLSLCLAFRDKRNDLLEKVRNPKSAYKAYREYKEVKEDSIGVFVETIIPIDAKIKEAIDTGNLILLNNERATLSDIEGAINGCCKEGDIVLIDYIQKIPPKEQAKSGNPDLERIRIGSEMLVSAAKSTGCVVISGAQLNRESQKSKEDKDKHKDTFSDVDFRGCGDIEQDGHNLVCIGRTDQEPIQHYYKIIKARESELNDIEPSLQFIGAYSYMKNTTFHFFKTEMTDEEFKEIEERFEKERLEKEELKRRRGGYPK